MKKIIENRSAGTDPSEVVESRGCGEALAVENESRRVTGYAIVFGSESRDLGGFREIIDAGALGDIINSCDVLALLDHRQERGVLARCSGGQGSLTLTIDERGLKYAFDAPNTALGDELLEGIRRGDITTSSFSFKVGKDKWSKRSDGTYLRTIETIAALYDVSPVYRAAYDATSVTVDRRGLDALIEAERRNQEPDPEPKSEPEPKPNPANKPETRNMNKKKKISLLRAIHAVASNQTLSEEVIAMNTEGRSAMAANGLTASGQLIIPMAERRAEAGGEGAGSDTTSDPLKGVYATIATQGQENVATDLLGIVEPLRNALVLTRAGATFMTGLVGNIDIPFYSGANVGWEGEGLDAPEGAGKFSKISMKPKRLTAYLDYSKQFLAQDSNGAEELLRRDIVDALSEKLESTILGAEAESDTQPGGLFYGVTADTANFKFTDVVDWEEELESAKIKGDFHYIVNPKVKATFRKTTKDTGSGRFVMEGGDVEGIPVLSTTGVVSKGMLLGNFRELLIGQWGGIDLTVDPYTQAGKAMVRLVINAYFDARMRRPAALVKHILK